jgi:signal peptidase I
MGEKLKREIYQWAIIILIVLLLRAVFVEAYVIPTPSMEKTLLIGDALLVNRFIYGVKIPYTHIPLIPGRMPQRGEIIVFRYPFENRDFVKRCVAVAGDTVQVINKILYVNGKKTDDRYAYHLDPVLYPALNIEPRVFQREWEKAEAVDIYGKYIRDNFGPVVLPRDYVFAMGDNRDNSLDSRFWGPLHKKYLKGKPLFIYFSFDPGGEAASILDILKFWRWKTIRLSRIGRVI